MNEVQVTPEKIILFSIVISIALFVVKEYIKDKITYKMPTNKSLIEGKRFQDGIGFMD